MLKCFFRGKVLPCTQDTTTFNIHDLPQLTFAHILTFLTPRDLAHLASTSSQIRKQVFEGAKAFSLISIQNPEDIFIKRTNMFLACICEQYKNMLLPRTHQDFVTITNGETFFHFSCETAIYGHIFNIQLINTSTKKSMFTKVFFYNRKLKCLEIKQIASYFSMDGFLLEDGLRISKMHLNIVDAHILLNFIRYSFKEILRKQTTLLLTRIFL